jgi:hypothetical protein
MPRAFSAVAADALTSKGAGGTLVVKAGPHIAVSFEQLCSMRS